MNIYFNGKENISLNRLSRLNGQLQKGMLAAKNVADKNKG